MANLNIFIMNNLTIVIYTCISVLHIEIEKFHFDCSMNSAQTCWIFSTYSRRGLQKRPTLDPWGQLFNSRLVSPWVNLEIQSRFLNSSLMNLAKFLQKSCLDQQEFSSMSIST